MMGRVPTSRSSGPRVVSPIATAPSTQTEGQPPREAAVDSRHEPQPRHDRIHNVGKNVSSTTPLAGSRALQLQPINAIACTTHIGRLSLDSPTTRPPVSDDCNRHRHHAPPDILRDTCTTSSHLSLQQHRPVAKRCGQTRVLRA